MHVFAVDFAMNEFDDESTAVFRIRRKFTEFASGVSGTSALSGSSVVSRLSFEG